jgi:hypothetical protein
MVRLCARRTRPVERVPGMCAFPCPAPPDHALSVAHIAAAPGPSQPPAAARDGASYPPDPEDEARNRDPRARPHLCAHASRSRRSMFVEIRLTDREEPPDGLPPPM